MQRATCAREPEAEAPAPSAPAPAASPQARILALQRSAGNRAVVQLLARAEYVQPTFGSAPTLGPGDWTDDDRKKKTARWKQACERNLLKGASGEYVNSAQRRDFYFWVYEATTAKGGETRWPLAAGIVAAGVNEITTLSSASEGILGAATNEVQGMMREGNQVIFDNVFPKLLDIYRTPLKGKAAVEWDSMTLAEEQNLIAPLYGGASKDAIAIVEGIAKGDTLTKMGSVISEASSVKAAANVKPGDVPYFTGNLLEVGDRWRYGMKLASTFSTIVPSEGGAPVAIPSGPPTPEAGYLTGAKLRAVDTRRNLHYFDAITDSTVNPAERKQAVNRLKLFTLTEQRLFLESAETYRERVQDAGLVNRDMLQGMSGWSHDLAAQLIFVHKMRGHFWSDIEYKEVKDMIKAAPEAKRKAINGAFWRGVFVDICNDKTIEEAVNDLGLTGTERQEWLDKERAVF